MQEALVVRRERHIPAPPAAVFAFLTDQDKILRWMGTEAQIEPQTGGLYLVNVTGARFARGSFREVVPVHRLAYSFGWDGSEVVPPGSRWSRLTFLTSSRTEAAAPDSHRPTQCRAMRRPCGRLGALSRPASRDCSRARPGPRPLARPHWKRVIVFRFR
jgi:uncharacterized protein YndB with AHSA1/START domain